VELPNRILSARREHALLWRQRALQIDKRRSELGNNQSRLTRNDKSKQVSSGGPITKDNTSIEYYDTIFTVMESPRGCGHDLERFG